MGQVMKVKRHDGRSVGHASLRGNLVSRPSIILQFLFGHVALPRMELEGETTRVRAWSAMGIHLDMHVWKSSTWCSPLMHSCWWNTVNSLHTRSLNSGGRGTCASADCPSIFSSNQETGTQMSSGIATSRALVALSTTSTKQQVRSFTVLPAICCPRDKLLSLEEKMVSTSTSSPVSLFSTSNIRMVLGNGQVWDCSAVSLKEPFFSWGNMLQSTLASSHLGFTALCFASHNTSHDESGFTLLLIHLYTHNFLLCTLHLDSGGDQTITDYMPAQVLYR